MELISRRVFTELYWYQGCNWKDFNPRSPLVPWWFRPISLSFSLPNQAWFYACHKIGLWDSKWWWEISQNFIWSPGHTEISSLGEIGGFGWWTLWHHIPVISLVSPNLPHPGAITPKISGLPSLEQAALPGNYVVEDCSTSACNCNGTSHNVVKVTLSWLFSQ